MSLGPVGNAIYANQQIASVASTQNNQNNRIDMGNVLAQAAANEKDEKVLEVRPAEENHEVDPDREHQKNEADQETERSEKEKKEEQEDLEKKKFSFHTLDIKV